jgi:hypothetical protein
MTALMTQLNRLDAYARAQILYAVEQRLSTGRIPDGAIRIVRAVGGQDTPQIAQLEIKLWSQNWFGQARAQRVVVNQLRGFFQASTDDVVVIEFVRTKKDPIQASARDIVDILVARGLDPAYRSRLMVRIVDTMDTAVTRFIATAP